MVIMPTIVEVQTKESMKLQLLILMETLLTRRKGMMIVHSSSLKRDDMNIQTVMILQQTYAD